jgi:hypothetical protein
MKNRVMLCRAERPAQAMATYIGQQAIRRNRPRNRPETRQRGILSLPHHCRCSGTTAADGWNGCDSGHHLGETGAQRYTG